MGKQARLKRERRLERDPLRILRSIHKTIQSHCHESGRRCWEYMLEMIAQSSGWDTESKEAEPLWEKMADDTRFGEFFQAWADEVERAKANRGPFSEPIGELLEEIQGTNDALGQYFTPMPVVRLLNEITLSDVEPPGPNGMPSNRGLDPCCGSGRFMIDALVHNDGVMMHGIDLDNWMLRAAKINVRLLAKWTSLRLTDEADVLKPLRRARAAIASLEMFTNEGQLEAPTSNALEPAGGTLIIGGRAIFMLGDSQILDLDYANNWLCAGWAWTPRPWRENQKIRGFYGSYNDWVEAGRPSLDQPRQNKVQFDYSMKDSAQIAP